MEGWMEVWMAGCMDGWMDWIERLGGLGRLDRLDRLG